MPSSSGRKRDLIVIHNMGSGCPNEKALQRERSHVLEVDDLLEDARHPGRHEDLPAPCLSTQARRQVGDGADGAVVPAVLEPDGADGGIALGDPDAEGCAVGS
jgi:hypothetical protein